MTGKDKSETHILIVDDNAMSRAVIERRLSRDGYGVVVANSGMEALSIISRQPIDLIFLDLVMEEMSGMDVLTSLKGDARYRDIPVVVISGTDDTDAIDNVRQAGASGFLPKPVMAETLQATVADILGGGSAMSSKGGGWSVVADAGTGAAQAQVINATAIERLASDYGKETTTEFIAKFEEMAPGLRAAITAAADAHDAAAWSRAAHDLKGGARTMGLLRLAAVCSDIEQACDNERLDDAAKATDDLGDYYDGALNALRDTAAGM